MAPFYIGGDTLKDFSKFVVCLVILLNVLFVVAVFALFWHTGSEPSTLIAGWFAFTTGELWGLSKIKRDKLNKKEGANDYD